MLAVQADLAEAGAGAVMDVAARNSVRCEPADVVGVVAFLASEDAGFVTGQVIYDIGGQRGPIRVDR